MTARVPVNKTYKMFVGGAFVRSESGRTFPVIGSERVRSADAEIVHVPRGSRKDARDAVLAARDAADAWSSRAPYGRGQILYRLAEVMESRRDELRLAVARGGIPPGRAAREVAMAIDRAAYYAGFCDKFQSLLSSRNPVTGPHFCFSVPEPMGVVAIVAPARPALLGLVSAVLPVVAGGNACVVVAREGDPRSAIVWCECVATSDFPAGVVNVITGDAGEIAMHLAKHREVAAIDAWIADADLRTAIQSEGSGNVKRVHTHDPAVTERRISSPAGQGLGWIERFLETKTVWYPVGI